MRRSYLWFLALVLVAILVLAGYYFLAGSNRGLTPKTALVVIKGEDLPYEVVSAIKPGDVVIDRYNKPYFEVVSATYTPFSYRGVDATGRVVYSDDPQRYAVYVTCRTINPFYDDVPLMAKQRVVVGRSITVEGPLWAFFGRVVSLEVMPTK